MQPMLVHINIFPVKSCSPLTVAHADVERRGLRGDRRWMIVDAGGKFVSARKQPRMLLIRAEFAGDSLVLDAPGMPRLHLRAAADSAGSRVTVWGDEVVGWPAGAGADAWITGYLGFSACFVFMPEECVRPVDPAYARPGDEVSFADGFPLLLISQAALDQLNVRLAAPVPMLRFRPSVVVANTTAHAEDGWRAIRIGEVAFDVVKPCVRCVLTTVDPATGTFDPTGEPLRTLVSYRRGAKGVTFGQNLIPRGRGTIRIGDAISIIE
ncbi:MAG: MOSC N-terminal beta barrel domain-containing protein [Dokdonella sp.]|uniref:MOSC domain-containing protein n=1 Tax=Dokdonella sp. TaxID=2291710 RepID=UPI003BB21F47